MFKKFSLAQLFVLQTAVSSHAAYLGNLVTTGQIPTDSTDPNVRAEGLVKLGSEYTETQTLSTEINSAINDKQIAAKAKANAKAIRQAAKDTANVA